MLEYKTDEYPEFSDSVSAVIDCFGPTDLNAILEAARPETDSEAAALCSLFCGGALDRELLKKMSPISYVQEGKSYVPFMIAHGSADPAVSFSQSEQLVKRLEECGAQVSFICVDGAVHEGNFWSRELWDIFRGFMKTQAGL